MRVVIEPQIASHNPRLYCASQTAKKLKGFNAVTHETLRQYEEQGFLVIANGFCDEEVQVARKTLQEMSQADDPCCSDVYYEGRIRDYIPGVHQKHKEVDGNLSFEALAMGDISDQLPNVPKAIRAKYVRKFAGFTESHPAMNKIACNSNMIRVIELLMGDKTRLFQDMAMIKPPGGREKPWRQDHAYFNLPLKTRIVGVWIALDKVTPKNGCMFLLAKRHRDGPRIHFMRRDWQICDNDMQGCISTSVPMEAGDVLLFDAKLPHGTPTNQSDTHRWAIQLHYVPEAVVSVDEQVRLQAFGNEGKNVTC